MFKHQEALWSLYLKIPYLIVERSYEEVEEVMDLKKCTARYVSRLAMQTH
jgi:hypothetical protein